MKTEIARPAHGHLDQYDPEKGLKSIAVAEAAQKHFARAKDASKLFQAIETKIDAEADYIVWRDASALTPSDRGKQGGRGKKKLVKERETAFPDGDPGDVIAHKWRKRFCAKLDGATIKDSDKIARAKDDAKQRCQRICEQQNANTIRGTEGTGEFERYTPPEYIAAARRVMGSIDLDPATSEIAQRTVQATEFFTAESDGLSREWHGRIWLNPPYHRELAPKFIEKLVEEFAAGRVVQAIMLTNNCTDTDWFLTALNVCSAICFTHGRIKFTQENGEEVLPTQGQAFFYFGNEVSAFAEAFKHIGFGVVPQWPFVE